MLHPISNDYPMISENIGLSELARNLNRDSDQFNVDVIMNTLYRFAEVQYPGDLLVVIVIHIIGTGDNIRFQSRMQLLVQFLLITKIMVMLKRIILLLRELLLETMR